MFGNLVVWYLFLGGLSGGATLAALAAHLLANWRGGSWRAFDRAFYRPLLIVSLVVLVAGCVCLLGDLKRPQMAHLLFIKPTLNVMNVGAILLLLFAVALAALVFAPAAPKRLASGAMRALEVATAALAFAVIAYTGIYLHSFWTVAPWTSPLIVVLFVLSSLSCGVGAVYACAAFARPDTASYRREVAAFERVDLVLVALEAVVLVAMLVGLFLAARAGELPGLVASLGSQGLTGAFFAGFIGCGLVVPGAVGVLGSRVRIGLPARCAILAVSLLVGGFFLRYCMIDLPLAYKAFMLAGI